MPKQAAPKKRSPRGAGFFTPRERSRIGIRARKLVRSGSPSDEALAASVTTCARAKARKLGGTFRSFCVQLHEELQAGGFFDGMPGAKLTWKQDDDGTWETLDDMQLMGVVAKGDRDNDVEIGEEWMLATLAKMSQNEAQQGHLAPSFVRHHDQDKSDPVPAGFVQPTRVALAMQDGKPKPALFGKLKKVPNDVYLQIRRFALPFRSVEVMAWNKHEIAGLALLSTRSPFFKQPMTTVGEEIPHPEVIEMQGNGAAVARFSGEDGRAAVLFEAGKFMDHEDKAINAEEGGGSEDPTLKEVVDTLKAWKPLIDQLAGLFDTGGEGEGGLMEEEEIIDEDAGNTAPVSASEGKLAIQLAEMQGELAALKANDRDRTKTDEVSLGVDATIAALSAYNVPDSTREHLVKMCEGHSKPAVLLSAWAKTFQATAIKDPPENLEALVREARGGGAGGSNDADVAKFAAQGPEVAEKAASFAKQYDECIRRGMHFSEDVTREGFIQDNLDRDKRQRVALGMTDEGGRSI